MIKWTGDDRNGHEIGQMFPDKFSSHQRVKQQRKQRTVVLIVASGESCPIPAIFARAVTGRNREVLSNYFVLSSALGKRTNSQEHFSHPFLFLFMNLISSFAAVFW